MAVRAPLPSVSLVDLTVELERDATQSDINDAMKKAAQGELKGILGYCEEPCVSIDFKGNPHSSIFDALSTQVMGGRLAKVLTWYDNEWGFSCRMGDLAKYIISKGL